MNGASDAFFHGANRTFDLSCHSCCLWKPLWPPCSARTVMATRWSATSAASTMLFTSESPATCSCSTHRHHQVGWCFCAGVLPSILCTRTHSWSLMLLFSLLILVPSGGSIIMNWVPRWVTPPKLAWDLLGFTILTRSPTKCFRHSFLCLTLLALLLGLIIELIGNDTLQGNFSFLRCLFTGKSRA